MEFGLSIEQDQLADAERAWLVRHDPIARARDCIDSGPIGIDRAAIIHAAESGLLGLLTAETGGSHVDLAVLSEMHGYAASSLPLADLAIACRLLELAAAPQADAAIEGRAVFGVTWKSAKHAMSAPLPMPADLDGVIVIDDSADGEYLAVVDNPQLVPMATLDVTRTWARTRLATAQARWLPLPSGSVALTRDAMAVHRAMDAIGAASRLLDMTVAYAAQRQQFGVPIGSFQAVKHHCANMVIGVEAGRSTLWAAALALDTAATPRERSRKASAAAAYAKAAASEVAGAALQVHGGIGFTWEHDLHLLLRRIKVDQAVNGTVAEHRAALVG